MPTPGTPRRRRVCPARVGPGLRAGQLLHLALRDRRGHHGRRRSERFGHVKNNETGEDYNSVTAADGAFTVPSLPGGAYSVTVSSTRFKTAVLSSVRLNAAVPASVKITLQVGALEESVTVLGEGAAVIQTRGRRSRFNNRDLPLDPATGKAPMAKLRQYQQGVAQGGPIMKNKAFFFFNYEELRQPSSSTPTRTVLTPDAVSRIFSYSAAGSVRQVNLLQLAAANGQLATLDPIVAKVLGDIRSATQEGGSSPRSATRSSSSTCSRSTRRTSTRRRPSASTTRSARTTG